MSNVSNAFCMFKKLKMFHLVFYIYTCAEYFCPLAQIAFTVFTLLMIISSAYLKFRN